MSLGVLPDNFVEDYPHVRKTKKISRGIATAVRMQRPRAAVNVIDKASWRRVGNLEKNQPIAVMMPHMIRSGDDMRMCSAAISQKLMLVL